MHDLFDPPPAEPAAPGDAVALADYAERVLVRVLRRRVHAAMVIAEKATRLGIVGKAFPADD